MYSRIRRHIPFIATLLTAAFYLLGPTAHLLACGTCLTCQLTGQCGGTFSEVYEKGQSVGAAAAVAAGAGVALPISPGSWTMALLPDTQIYAQNYPQHFDAQTQWLRDNAVSHNIKAVLHEGDITNRNTTDQWDNAKASMSKLDGSGIAYMMAPGNHDYGPNGGTGNRTTYFSEPQYFGPGSPYAQQPSIGGFFESGKTDNSWSTFSAGGNDWLVLALEFGPRDEVVDWAASIVEANPDKLAILVTHAYMYYDETIYDWATKGPSQQWNPHSYGIASQPGGVNDGQELWDKLAGKYENFRFVFNGHVLGDGTGYRATVGENGNVVHQILANYQFNVEGGQGDMRLLEFLEDGKTVKIRTYSPVLDRYNTAADQQFDVILNELPPPPPILYHAAAGNLVVTGPTDNTDNTVEGLSVTHTGNPPINFNSQINRGDYQITVDGRSVNFQQGVMLASVTQHSRPDFDGRAVVEVGRNSFGDGNLSLSVAQAGVSGTKELNFNTSVAWFDFAGGWTGAHVNGNNGTLALNASNNISPGQVTRTNTGRYTVNLGANAQNEGLLFVIGNNNANTVVQTGLLPGGTTWDVRVDDAGAEFGATGKDRDWSFVYLPYSAENMIGGLYDGLANTHISSAGDFTMTRLATGQYQLSIPGQSPETGMLITTITHETTLGPTTAPDDNILTYEAGPNGTFLINSYDMPTLNFQNTKFSWAFIGFEDKLSLEPIIPGVEFKATIDRTTGVVTLTNSGAEVSISQVTLLSGAGSLIPGNWNSITENYDQAPGDGSVDADGSWTILSSTPFNLKEALDGAGDGGLLTMGQAIDLGEIWKKSRYEDVTLQVKLAEGQTININPTFTGGAAYSRSDLNADGLVDPDDWAIMYPNLLTDISALSPVDRALAGDINGDGVMNVQDFILFKADFDLAQGAGSFDAMLARVPEPATVVLVASGLAIVGCFRRRRAA
jgi:hypothetical protein